MTGSRISPAGRRTTGGGRPCQRAPVNYAQFDARISRLATHLRDGVKIARGDRVAVLAHNTTDTLEVQFACGRIGAVFLPLNTRLTVPELSYIVGDAAPKLMIHDTELADLALAVAKLCKVTSALLLGAGVPTKPRSRPQNRSTRRKSSPSIHLDDHVHLGTTGQPKAPSSPTA